MNDNEKLDLLLSEMQEMKQDFHLLKEDVHLLKEDVHLLKEDTQTLKDSMEKLTEKTDMIERRVTNTDLIIENEIRVNIQRVAEGHLDLSRDLHEAMHPNSEVEMLAIKVRMLESDMKKIKAKVL